MALSSKESAHSAGDPGWSWIGKILMQRRNGNPIPVFLFLGNPKWQRSLAGYSPWGHKRALYTDRVTFLLSHTWAEIPQSGGKGGRSSLAGDRLAELRGLKAWFCGTVWQVHVLSLILISERRSKSQPTFTASQTARQEQQHLKNASEQLGLNPSEPPNSNQSPAVTVHEWCSPLRLMHDTYIQYIGHSIHAIVIHNAHEHPYMSAPGGDSGKELSLPMKET